jgi:hypothetical protein
MGENMSRPNAAAASHEAAQASPTSAPRRLLGNLLTSPWQFRDSVIRQGQPTSNRAASEAVFGNLFLHILPTRIHRYSLQIRATLGLGVITLVLFFLLVLTGIALMVYSHISQMTLRTLACDLRQPLEKQGCSANSCHADRGTRWVTAKTRTCGSVLTAA